MCAVPGMDRRMCSILRNWSFASCKSLCDCLEPNAGPFKEWEVFLDPKHFSSTKTNQSSISLRLSLYLLASFPSSVGCSVRKYSIILSITDPLMLQYELSRPKVPMDN